MFIPMLSAFVDGELPPKDRVNVERHLAACRECTGRAADLRAESGLIRVGMEMAADEVDFTGFSQKVLARLTPYKPPLLERWRVSVSELFRYHRGMMVSSMVTAAVLVVVGLPLLMRERQPDYPPGYANEFIKLESVSVAEGAHADPLVIFGDDGDVIIMMIPHDHPDGGPESLDEGGPVTSEDEEENVGPARPSAGTKMKQDRPSGGEL